MAIMVFPFLVSEGRSTDADFAADGPTTNKANFN